jgi:predicted regulator of Ras-like GTPase activity (Roadblock/LC7/MglB family)
MAAAWTTAPSVEPVVTRPCTRRIASDQPQRLLELIHRLPTFHRFSPAAPVSTLIEPLILETENSSTDLPDQDNLQSLFLTDEKLTVRRVVELCGDLPGIRSCVLTCEDSVIASHNVPENLDLVAMSSTASKMLQAMQESSSQLGIGAIPALTLHTERGPLSIVQNNRLTMLVIHSDRGFIPGVREKLTAALGELSHAPLALPSAAPLPALGMPLPPDSESL